MKSGNLVRLVLVPPLAIGGFALLLGLRVPAVVNWFWPAPTTNIAEAAALGDAARVRTLAAGGARVDVPLPVDPRWRQDGAPGAVSALEAAIRRRGESLLQVILDLDVHLPPQEARRLYCLAVDLEAGEVAALIQDVFELPSGTSCGADSP